MQEKRYWLDSKENVIVLFRWVWILCGLMLIGELVVHLHPYFEAEDQFGFYALIGFFGCIIAILGALALRAFLGRPEDYYDE